MENENIEITKEIAIIGIMSVTQETNKLNACLQLARWYIYCEKLNLTICFLYKFLCLLKHKIKIERLICQGNNQMSQFRTLWQSIENYLD
jgi:hypothetical protein